MIRLRRLGITLLLLIGVIAMLLSVIGYSDGVLRGVAARLPDRFGNIERLSVRDVSGSFAGGFRVGAIDIEVDNARISIRDIESRVLLWPLFWQEINLVRLQVGQVEVDVMPRDQPIPDRPLRFLPALLSIESADTRVGQLFIRPIVGSPVLFTNLQLNTIVRSRTLNVRSLRAALAPGALVLESQGVLTAARPLQVDAEVRATFTAQRGPTWRLSSQLDGDLETLDVEATLTEPFQARIDSSILRALPPWRFDGEAAITDLDLTRFGGGAALGALSGSLQLQFDQTGYRAKGQLLPPRLEAGPFDIEAQARYARGEVTLERVELAHASGLAADVTGTVNFAPDGPVLGLNVTWSGLRWPLDTALARQFLSERGALRVTGEAPYRLEGTFALKPEALPALAVSMQSQLVPGGLALKTAEISVLSGRTQIQGELRWSPEWRWQVRGEARGIDPQTIRPALTGNLDIDFTAQGSGLGNAAQLSLDWSRLSGRLRGTAARGSGGVSLAGDRWTFRKVDLSAGGFRLALDGTLSQARRDLRFTIDAEDLGVLARDGRGRLRAKGSLRGTPDLLQLALDASGSDIALGGVTVDELRALIDLDPLAGPEAPVRANLEARGLSGFGRQARQLRFAIDGRVAEHTLSIDIDSRDLGLRAQGRGQFDAKGWKQQWDRFDLDLVEQVQLGLTQAFEVSLGATGVSLGSFCLRGRDERGVTGSATLCGAGQWSDTAWDGRLDIQQLPLAALLPRPSSRLDYDGLVNASVSARSAPEGLPFGQLRAEFTDARLRWLRANGREERIPLGSGIAEFDSTLEGLTGRLSISAADRGRARGALNATRTGDGARDWRAMPLKATLQADSSALALLYLYVREIDRSAGDLSADLTIGGTLGTPLVNGVLQLEKGELDFYQVNLSLRDITAEARLIDNGFVLRSTARTGEGRIAADADLTWRRGEPYGALNVKGENLRVIDLPEARILASPDLRFEVAGRNLRASGRVLIPEARITPIDLTGAQVTSADEVLVGAEPRNPAGTFAVSSNLTLVLGERVTIEAFGLTGRVGGTLNLVSSPDGTNRAAGELAVTEGKYAAFGRLLDIERGRLIFSGGLLGEPALDVRATKVFPEVKAGVNVRGTLREPRMTFFSVPSLPQSQIVSLVLAGGTGESAGTTQSGTAIGRDALLAQGSAILAQQFGQRLGKRLGIEDVGIEQNLANETSLVFGRYLSSRLYISYGISLAEAINTVKMRYSFNDRWTLRTEAGREASAEVVYTVEKN
ncbi:MAG: translocation/assembly module TamB domain-containing protein [Steroidobacteraceae bacterium]